MFLLAVIESAWIHIQLSRSCTGINNVDLHNEVNDSQSGNPLQEVPTPNRIDGF